MNLYVPMNPGTRVRNLRQSIYDVLKQHHPVKLSASEIASLLGVTPDKVVYAIRYYSLRSRHFAVYHVGNNVFYSVYLIDPPYNAFDD